MPRNGQAFAVFVVSGCAEVLQIAARINAVAGTNCATGFDGFARGSKQYLNSLQSCVAIWKNTRTMTYFFCSSIANTHGLYTHTYTHTYTLHATRDTPLKEQHNIA